MTKKSIYIKKGVQAPDGRVRYEFVIIGTGKPRRQVFGLDDLIPPATKFFRWVSERNLLVTQEVKQEVAAELERRPTPKMGYFAELPGWYGKSFVTPRRIYGEDRDVIINDTPATTRSKWRRKGDLHEFRRWARKNLDYSPVAIFLMAHALAGPLLRWTGHKSIVAMLVGPSSIGKSTLQRVCGSLWGGADGKDFMETFSKSLEPFESAALRHRDCLLVLNETHLLDRNEAERGRKLQNLLFRFESGVAKEIYGKETPSEEMRGALLLSSNETTADILRKAGREFSRELAVRILEIPVDGSFPVFKIDESNMATRMSRVDAYSEFAQRVYGVVRHEYLIRLAGDVAADEEEVAARVAKFRRAGLKLLGVPELSSEIDARLASQVATIYAAGRMAYHYGVLPFDRDALRFAIRAVWPRILQSAMNGLRRNPSAEFARRLLDALPNFVDFGSAVRFKDEAQVFSSAGFVKRDGETSITIWLTVPALQRYTALPDMVLETLDQKGILQRSSEGRSGARRQVKRAVYLDDGTKFRPRMYKLRTTLDELRRMATS